MPKKLLAALVSITLTSSLFLTGCGEEEEQEEDEAEWISFLRGWTQMDPSITDDALGMWIEEEDVALAAACDADLGATAESAGLALARYAEAPSGHGENASSDRPPSIDDLFAPRPDLAEAPAPIFNTSFRGRISDLDDGEAFSRLVEIDPAGRTGSEPIFVRQCATMYERGHCYVPGNGFSFSGCNASVGDSPGFMISPQSFQTPGADWELSYNDQHDCEAGNDLDASHPDIEDHPLGRHHVTIFDAAELPEGEAVELNGDDIEWLASYQSQRHCPELYNPGEECQCTWSYREVTQFDRASALIEGGRIYVNLRGAGDDEGFFLWGQFDLVEPQ